MFSPVPLGQGMSMASALQVIDQNFKKIESEGRTQIIRDESGIDRILIGRAPDGKYYIKVSKEGVNVLDAPDSDLIFNSSNNLFKIVKTGTTTVNAPATVGTSTSAAVTHTLGKNPTVMAFVSFSPTGTAFPMPHMQLDLVSSPGRVNNEISFEASASNTITFFWRRLAGGASGTAYIRYYIIQETASYS